MSNSEEIVDHNSAQRERKSIFQTFAMLSYIGNSIWGILFLLLFIGCIINGEGMLREGDDTSRVTFYLIVSALILMASILCIIGVMRMKRGKKAGFYAYAFGNLIWIGLLFYDAGRYGLVFPVLAGISAVFVIYYALRLPKLS